MLNFSKRTMAGILTASFMVAGCSNTPEETAAYCYDNSGQTILSGQLGAQCTGSGSDLSCEDRGIYTAYYKAGNILAGYEESKVSMGQHNQKIRQLCRKIARGDNIDLPAPAQH